ncbi:MAG TPA: hypothetical protein VMV04_25365 [Thermodesulfobacteriota bacterium]|nr:hypothetical protein [Thermodesulfobacteriota bacterium]
MDGKRVIEYGYPKVHDGKNVVYDLRHSNPKLGIDPKTDAYIGGANWGMYYFAVIGIKLAELNDDIFTKTAILRIPFALAGLIGLVIFAYLGAQFFENKLSKYGFLTLFAFFELISIPLVLHLREARYYSLTVFLTALIIFIYARYRILKKTEYLIYAIFLTLSLFLLFITFSPVYFIFLIGIFLYESIDFVKDLFSKHAEKSGQIPYGRSSLNQSFKYYLQSLVPLILSLIAVSPLISFFKTFYIAEETAKFNRILFDISEWEMYLVNLSMIWRHFRSFDLIYLAIFLKFCVAFFVIRLGIRETSSLGIRKLMFSNFLTIIFVVYFFAIAQIPNFPFTRYFIPLQPVLAVMIILDVALVYNLISSRPPRGIEYYKIILLIVFTGFILTNVVMNIDYIRGHVYELSHQYKGPLDYVIPFIKENYKDTDELVIAANYEETSFMYYLGSKVIIGYVGNNLEEDTRVVPDIIVYRKGLGDLHRRIFLDFFGRHSYRRISFPVLDYKVNNIPELNISELVEHQFRTVYTRDERMKTDMYLKR